VYYCFGVRRPQGRRENGRASDLAGAAADGDGMAAWEVLRVSEAVFGGAAAGPAHACRSSAP
jgi:hypothetical protein